MATHKHLNETEAELIFLAEEEYGEVHYQEAAPDVESLNGRVGEIFLLGSLAAAFIAFCVAFMGLVGFIISGVIVGLLWYASRQPYEEGL